MLLHEAAISAGVAATFSALGRPTCMAVPAALGAGMVVSSACTGNRVYTDLGDGELYAMLPGRDLFKLASKTRLIGSANATLQEYYRARRQQLTVFPA
jgi:uncharacterized protein (DUF169 family)